MKKRTLIISGILILTLGMIGIWKINNEYYPIWNSNTINVTTDRVLNMGKVKIEFGISVNTINRTTDTDLFKNREKYTTLFNGSVKEKMSNDYGENDFLITYNDKYYLSFRQFKFNWKHQHDYKFHFYKKSKKIFVQVDIKGQDAMKFERPMLKINSADRYRCNTPIDRSGTIYNMIELK